MLKRAIEREFADLFPREPTFIVGKLEDQYGYALSNSSFVFEILKNGDRITAYPEDIFGGNGGGERRGSPSMLNGSNQQNDIGIKGNILLILGLTFRSRSHHLHWRYHRAIVYAQEYPTEYMPEAGR